jgi:Right handed beta helix region
VTIEELALLTLSRGDTVTPAIAMRNSSAITLQRNALARVGIFERALATVGLGGVLVGVLIRENLILGAVGIGRFAVATAPKLKKQAKAVAVASEIGLLTADLAILDNTLDCARRGISFDAVSIHAFQTRLAGNLIVGCDRAGINMLGWVFPGSGLDVRENEIHTSGAGIVVGTDDTRVEANHVAPTKAGEGTDGIVLTLGFDKTGLDRCQILGNCIVGIAGNGIHIVNAIVRSAMIKNNFIEAVGAGGIVMDDDSTADHLTIENNQVLNVAPLVNDANIPIAGVRVVRAVHGDVSSNIIIGIGGAAVQNPSLAGIQVLASLSARIAGNQVADIGPATNFLGEGVGIECTGTFERLDIADNNVRRNQNPPADPDRSQWLAVLVRGPADKPGPGVGTHFIALENTVFAFVGNKIFALPRGREIVIVQDNLCDAYGEARVVFVGGIGTLTFTGNRCLFNARRAPVVEAAVRAAIASSNYLQGTANVPTLVLQLPEAAPFTVLGNITSGPIQVNGATLTPPWAPLNVVAS